MRRVARQWATSGIELLEGRRVPSGFTMRPRIAAAVRAQQDEGPLEATSAFASSVGLVGGSANYVIQLTNTTEGPIDNVVLVDTLPDSNNAELLAISSSNGTVPTIVDGVATFDFGTVPAGETVSVTIAVRPTAPSTLTNVATVTSDVGTTTLTQTSRVTQFAAPPSVIGFQRLGVHRQATRLVLTFDQDMSPNGITNASQYLLAPRSPLGRFGVNGRFVKVRSAVYDAESRTLVLTPNHPIPLRQVFQLVVNGNFAGLRNTNGVLLDGDGDGLPGGNFVVTFQGLE